MSEFRAKDHRLTNPGRSGPQSEAAPLVPEQRRTMAGVVSFLSSNERQGYWELPRRFRALAVLGNVELDLREAEIGYGLSVIEAVAVLGNVEIKVSPDISVECDGDSLDGNLHPQVSRPRQSVDGQSRQDCPRHRQRLRRC